MSNPKQNPLLASALSPFDDLPSVLIPSVPKLDTLPDVRGNTLQPHLIPTRLVDAQSRELKGTSSVAPPVGLSNLSCQAESLRRKPKGKYVVPSDISTQINLANLGSPSITQSTISGPFMPPPPVPSVIATMSSNYEVKPASFEAIADNPPIQLGAYHPVIPHWFFCETKLNLSTWLPFSFTDSLNIEEAFRQGSPTIVPTDGGRYDVNVAQRQKLPVYWDAKPRDVRRCSWFRKDFSGPLPVPYTEEDALKLEDEFKQAMATGRWHRQVVLAGGERVVINSPAFIQHYDSQEFPEFPNTVSLAEAQQTPQLVRRGADDFTIPDCSADKVDHLLFMIHGIGSFCDLSFRGVEDCVDDFRKLGEELLASHFKESIDAGRVGRLEILPISWHKALHGDATGIDNKLKLITLRSIPKFREFTNDTLLDVLFFTSPVYGQHIMDTVASEMERLLDIFKGRNPEFGGKVSVGGHSLGTVILFDLLLHQKSEPAASAEATDEKEDSNGEKENGWIKVDSAPETSSPSTSKVNFEIGMAGTGQPAINYPQLSFKPQAFFLMGAPVGMFVTVRGLDALGPDFKLPTCNRVFNIFHPFDPVAYRIETLIDPSLSELRPVLIPHHKGRKRMHLELKDTIERVGSDIKNRIFDSIQATWNTMYQLYSGDFNPANQALEDDLMADDIVEPAELCEPQVQVGKLNGGRRIDYVLQEKPYESFTEYIFALQAHLTYWSSEDTLLMILKELYSIEDIYSDVALRAKRQVRQPLVDPNPPAAEILPMTSSGSTRSFSTPSLLQLAKEASATSTQPFPHLPEAAAGYVMPPHLRQPPSAPMAPPPSAPMAPPPMGAIPTQPIEPTSAAPGTVVTGMPPISAAVPRVISGRPVFDPSMRPAVIGVDPTATPASSTIGPPPKLPKMSFKKK